jgi:hypothetical protein
MRLDGHEFTVAAPPNVVNLQRISSPPTMQNVRNKGSHEAPLCDWVTAVRQKTTTSSGWARRQPQDMAVEWFGT